MSEKQLESTVAAAEYQKAWFAELRRDVFEKQKPYAIVQADMPLELFQAMDVPTVSNQWWAAIISAKRLSPIYLDCMNSKRLSRRPLPLLQPRAGIHFVRRCRAAAVGRTSPPGADGSSPHLRLHSAGVSKSGPKPSARSSSRSMRPALPNCLPAGGNSAAIDGANCSRSIGWTSWWPNSVG